MSDWRIHQRYGYGAGLVPLTPELVAARTPEPSFAAGLQALADEFHGQGVAGNVRFVVRGLPAVAFVLTLLFALLTTVTRERIDQTDIEIVALEPVVLPEPEVIEPPPEPEIVEPPPPPVQVAEVEPPPPAPPAPKLPPPPPKRVIEPPKPPPAPKVARVEPPKPKPPPPPKRVVRKPAPPKVRIDPLPVRPEPTPAPVVARVERAEPKPQMPKIAPPPPIAMDPVPPEKPVLAAAPRAAARSAPRSMKPPPRIAPPSLAPVAVDVPDEPSTRPPPTRTARRAPSAPRKAAVAPNPVSFDLAPPPEAAASQAPAPPSRSARATPVAASSPRRAMPESLTPASGLSGGPAPTNAQAEPGSNRIDRVAPSARAGRNRPDDRLEGVALSSLAACRSDGEEDKLKRQVMAHIDSRKECASDAGRYRFIETKNLNAFLMLIERAPHRPQADRCVELRLTLECLGAR